MIVDDPGNAPSKQKATVFETADECGEGTYEASGGTTGFSPWGSTLL